MYFLLIFRIIGFIIILFSLTMFFPYILSFIYLENTNKIFIKTFLIIFLIGLCLWFPNRNIKNIIQKREGFLIVVLLWIVLGVLGALPFIFYDKIHLSITDAIFESFSGLTTTGATTLTDLDIFPKSILFYRQMLQWFGGIGVVVLVLVIFPSLGMSGVYLYHTETIGPLKDNKILPRVTNIAKSLFFIYVLLTSICAFLFWLFGMSCFDAISHSFSTVSIGGFSTHDNSIGYFNSESINIITTIFLILSSCNYTLHFLLLSNYSLSVYLKNVELQCFIIIQLMLFIITILLFFFNEFHVMSLITLMHIFIQIIFIETTSGFIIEKFSLWPSFLPILLLVSTIIGGCSGSMGGGSKIIRMLLLFKHISREIKLLVHPNALYKIKIGDMVIPTKTLNTVWGFFLYIF